MRSPGVCHQLRVRVVQVQFLLVNWTAGVGRGSDGAADTLQSCRAARTIPCAFWHSNLWGILAGFFRRRSLAFVFAEICQAGFSERDAGIPGMVVFSFCIPRLDA